MFKFFVSQKKDNHFILDAENLKHIKVVKVDNQNIICIYKKQFYVCHVRDNKAKIINQLNLNNEFNGNVVLASSIIDKKNFELLIQKATELGVKVIIPILSQNRSFKIDNLQNALIRWKAIAKNAAQQSFRNIIPDIFSPLKFEEVLDFKIKNKFIAHEKIHHNFFLSFPTDSLFLIGPEGGFTDQEIKVALQKGFKSISLGKRILRAETAAMFILARINEPSIAK